MVGMAVLTMLLSSTAMKLPIMRTSIGTSQCMAGASALRGVAVAVDILLL